jgi:GntR family transcriptional regulator
MPDRHRLLPHSAEGDAVERGSTPLYAQLARLLRTQISSGEFKPGDPLATEGEICRAYGVSRITAREALRILSDEGLILRQPGRGTFVANRPGLGVSVWTAGTIAEIIQGGHKASRRYLGRRVLPANRGPAVALQLPLRTRVVEIQSLVTVREVPLAHMTLTVPYALGRTLNLNRLGQQPIIVVLAEMRGLTVSAVDQWMTASLADKRIGDLLEVAVGDPILVVERVFYDGGGRPIEVVVNRYRTDRFRLHVQLKKAVAPAERRRVLRALR